MLMVAAALTLAEAAFGAPFPAATLVQAPKISAAPDTASGRTKCFVDYTLRSGASISTIAQFYLEQGRAEKAKLLSDTKDRFQDYRTIAFKEPNFMFVTLSREKKATVVKVTLRMPDGCRAPGASL